MKFAKLLCPLLANTEAFGDTDKSSIGIPKIGEDLTVSCEGSLLFMTPIYKKCSFSVFSVRLTLNNRSL